MGKLKRSRYLPWNSAQVVHELHWFRRFLRQKLHASNWDIYELEGFHLQLRWNLRKAAGFFSLFISPFKPHIQFCWTTPKKITLKPTKSGRFAPRNSHCFQVMMTFGRQLWMWPSSRLGADRISTDGMEWNITLPEANSSHLKNTPLEVWRFLLETIHCRGYVSFRECSFSRKQTWNPTWGKGTSSTRNPLYNGDLLVPRAYFLLKDCEVIIVVFTLFFLQDVFYSIYFICMCILQGHCKDFFKIRDYNTCDTHTHTCIHQ